MIPKTSVQHKNQFHNKAASISSKQINAQFCQQAAMQELPNICFEYFQMFLFIFKPFNKTSVQYHVWSALLNDGRGSSKKTW